MVEVVGRRLDQLPRAATAHVVERWPRGGSSVALLEATRHQAQRRPQSRAALLHSLGFTELVDANPLDSNEQTPV